MGGGGTKKKSQNQTPWSGESCILDRKTGALQMNSYEQSICLKKVLMSSQITKIDIVHLTSCLQQPSRSVGE